MKVEFLDTDVLGAKLLISAPEFVKAKNDEREYDSLVHATAAFANLLGLVYQISEDEFDAIIARLDKAGAVIFTIGEDKYPTRRWCEIYVSNNNQIEKIAYEDKDGYHLRRYGKYNPKAIVNIKKKYETGGPLHE